MAIGGLIKQKKSEDIRRVPWLSDIPVIGSLFKQRTKKSGWDSDVSEITDVELFITLTPRVVSEVKPQEEVRTQVIKLPSIHDDRIKDPVVKYSKLVQKRVLSAITYPTKAKEAGFQGTVMLNLKLSPQGELLESTVKESSGYRILDDAAIQRAQDTAPYPPFPPEIKEKEVWVDIPITYQLE
jgi:TonB family protein